MKIGNIDITGYRLGNTSISSIYLGATQIYTAFTPLSLFASGEQGAWYDPSDLSSMNTLSDQTGTTPAVGDPVGYIADKSGNGNHATQVTASYRPTLRQDGNGNYYLEFDGVNDNMNIPSITTNVGPVSGFFATRLDSVSSSSLAYVLDINVGRTVFQLDNSITAGMQVGIASDGTIAAANNPSVGSNFIYSGIVRSTNAILRLNGVEEASGNLTEKAVSGLIKLGAGTTAFNGMNGAIYGAILVLDDSTTQEITDTETHLAAKSGVTL